MASAVSALLGAEPWVAPELPKPWEWLHLQTLGGREGARVEVGDAAQAIGTFTYYRTFYYFPDTFNQLFRGCLNCRLHSSPGVQFDVRGRVKVATKALAGKTAKSKKWDRKGCVGKAQRSNRRLRVEV